MDSAKLRATSEVGPRSTSRSSYRLGDLRVISDFVDGGVISRPSILSSQWVGRRAVADEPRSAEVSLGGGRAKAHPPFFEEKKWATLDMVLQYGLCSVEVRT